VTPEGPGSVSGAPNLPAGFADTFHEPVHRHQQLVAGPEDAFYRWEFDAAAKGLPDDVIDY
jgi:hypothetical protein